MTGLGELACGGKIILRSEEEPLTYPPPTPHTLSPLLYVVFLRKAWRRGEGRGEERGWPVEVGLAALFENTVDCFGKILWPEAISRLLLSVDLSSTDAVGEPGGGGEGTAEAGWFLAIVGSFGDKGPSC